MKKFLSLLVFMAASALSAQAQTTPPATPEQPAVLTPEMQQQRATEARNTYDTQKKETNASQRAAADTRSAMKDSKQQMRAQKQQMHEQKDQLKAQRQIEKANKDRERAARTQMKEEKKRAKEMK